MPGEIFKIRFFEEREGALTIFDFLKSQTLCPVSGPPKQFINFSTRAARRCCLVQKFPRSGALSVE
jgi:hypothetical protein